MSPKKAERKHKKGKKGKEIATTFVLSAPGAQHVSVAGDFNQWNTATNALGKDDAGVWAVTIKLPPGRYQYRFFVDGEWQNDPDCPSCVENPFGTLNCLRVVE